MTQPAPSSELKRENAALIERVFPQRWPASFRTFIEGFPRALDTMLDAAREEGSSRPAPPPADAVGEKLAPVQGFTPGIPWEMHLRAYDAYCKKYGAQKALIEGGCRGGFGTRELDAFIPGWRDELSERTAMKNRISELEALLSSPRQEDPAQGRALDVEAVRRVAITALREIAFLRPPGPTRSKLVEQIERIAIDALNALSNPDSAPMSADGGGGV